MWNSLSDDEFYIDVFEKQFKEIDFSGLKGAESITQKAENIQIMIDFLGNSVYETDLNHIEAVEILQNNYEHINRFVTLIYEWTIFQSGNHIQSKKHMELGSSDIMPTADTYGNIGTQNKTNIIDFYSKSRPELKVEKAVRSKSNFRILGNNDDRDNPDNESSK